MCLPQAQGQHLYAVRVQSEALCPSILDALVEDRQLWVSPPLGFQISTKNSYFSQAWGCMPVIPATQELEAGGSQVEGQPRAKLSRPHLKHKTQGLEAWWS
jgi:hypothetical protein